MPRRATPLTKRLLDQLRRRAELEMELEAATGGELQKVQDALDRLPMKPAEEAALREALEAAEAAGKEREVKRLRATLERPVLADYLADGGQPGLYAQSRRGRVRFFFRYRTQSGSRRTIDIDSYGAITLVQAQEIAAEHRFQVAKGLDPMEERAERKRQGMTLAEAVDGYLANFEELVAAGTKKRSSLGSARARLERHVVPTLGQVPLRDVTADQVRRVHRGMKSTPGEANRTLTALSAVFGWADRAELLPGGTNPMRYVERYRENGRRRALTSEEMARLGEVLHEADATGGVKLEERGKRRYHAIHPSAVLAVRLLALTGMRAAEVFGHGTRSRRGRREGLRWGDVDLAAGLVHLHTTKTGRQVRVLGAAAVELLRVARPAGAADSDPVCPGEKPGAPLVGTGRPRRYLWQAAGIDETAAGRADLHSLRHSFASVGAQLQGGRFVGMVAPLLGHAHQGRGVTESYIHANPEFQRPAADAIAGELAGLLGLGEPGRVVAFPAAVSGR